MRQESNNNRIPLMRVVKGNYDTRETLSLSEPLTLKEAMKLEKTMVPDLPERGGDTLLVKLVEDYGPEFDYMSIGGWLIFTHRESVPW